MDTLGGKGLMILSFRIECIIFFFRREFRNQLTYLRELNYEGQYMVVTSYIYILLYYIEKAHVSTKIYIICMICIEK